ncbi:MAG: hypothetical protein WBI18_05535, partial [Candidatus Saccharicenans sp.]
FFKCQPDKSLCLFNPYPNSWPTTTPPPYTTLTLDTMSVPERKIYLTLLDSVNYNQIAGWRGILLSPASFSLKTLAPHQPASKIKSFYLHKLT